MQQFIKVTVEKLVCLEIHSIFISLQLGIFHSPQKEKKNQRIKRKWKKKTSSWRLQSKDCHVQFTGWFVPISHSLFPSISFIYVTLIQVIHLKNMMEVGPKVFSIRQTGSNVEQASESGCYSVIWVTWPVR